MKKNHSPKIAIVASLFPTVSETFVLNHITGLIDLGYEVDVYAFDKEHCDYPDHQQLTDYELEKRTKYLPTDFAGCSEATSHFIEQGYAVVHCHFGEVAERLSFLKPRMPDCLFFVTFHGRDLRLPVEHGGQPYANTFRLFDRAVAICDYNRQLLLKIGCPAEKLADIPNSVNTQVFAAIERKVGRVFRLVTVARLHEAKNIPFALDVLKRFKEEFDQFSYTLVGHGKLRAEIELLITAYGLDEHVRLLGQCSQGEVVRQLQQADAFFLPSQAEASPVCLLEAQACGLPVVTTRVGGTAELIEHGVTGYCVEVNDVDTACNRLLELVREPAKSMSMGDRGRRFILDNHDFRKCMRQLREMYRTSPSPRVTIIIPTHNRSTLIGRGIESVLSQSYQDFELIIIDDGSDDDTESVVQHYVDQNPGTIHYVYIPWGGASVARNKGVELAQGEYIAFLDSDDYWHPDKLVKQVAFLDAHPHVGFVHTRCQIQLTDAYAPVNMVPVSDIPANDSDDYLRGDRTISMTVMIRREIILQSRGFDETFLTTQDTELWTRLAKKTQLALLDEVLAYVRRHTQHLSSDDPERKYRDRIRLAEAQINDDHPSICDSTWRRFRNRNSYGLAKEIYKKRDFKNARAYLFKVLRAELSIGKVMFSKDDRLRQRIAKLLEPYFLLFSAQLRLSFSPGDDMKSDGT
jgi:colanic acid/amylovoran biosynthesis glycosyltransferase